MSRVPLFVLLFNILHWLRDELLSAPELLELLNRVALDERTLLEGIDISGIYHNVSRLKIQLPRPLLCDWSDMIGLYNAPPLGEVSHTAARWQGAWALSVLLSRSDGLVGETLATLLAATLLEQKVLLLGDVPRISAMALLLRSLLWPFRWLHLFLSAPPPKGLLSMPLLDSPFPVMLVVSMLPEEWGYKTQYALPPEVVTGVLKHDHVQISQQLETTGGVRQHNLRLPGGRHKAFVTQAAQTKQRLRNRHLDLHSAVESIQTAAEDEVGRLAELLRTYALEQIARTKLELVSSGRCDAKLTYDRCIDIDLFTAWLTAEGREEGSTKDSVSFYTTFFQTQLSLDYMSEVLSAQACADDALSSPGKLGGGSALDDAGSSASTGLPGGKAPSPEREDANTSPVDTACNER